jgi:hypothetical protein
MAWRLILFVLLSPRLLAHQPVTARYSFSEHVLPVLEARCGGCHRQGGAGPMALLEYQEARPWAEAIKERVLERSMPPWFAEPGFEPLAGEHVLSPREVDILVDWASGGAPEGKKPAPAPASRKPPPAPPPPDNLELRSYDLGEVSLGAQGLSTTSILTDPAEDRHLASFTIAPGNPAVLRSALVYLEGGTETRQLLGAWVPGQEEVPWSGGAGLKLSARSKLRIELGYEKPQKLGGESLRVRAKLVAKLLRAPPRLEVLVTEVRSSGDSLPPDALLLAFFPDPALGPGRLLLGTGESEKTLLQLFATKAAWPITYRFLAPPAVVPGETLRWVPAGGCPEVGRVGLVFCAVPRASEKK